MSDKLGSLTDNSSYLSSSTERHMGREQKRDPVAQVEAHKFGIFGKFAGPAPRKGVGGCGTAF